MSVKCPSCGFESPAGSQWCDFCKQPFNKRLPRPATAAPREASPLDGFEHLDKGGDIPKLPPWFRPMAWAMLGICLFWMMALAGYYLGKKKVLEEASPPGGGSLRTGH